MGRSRILLGLLWIAWTAHAAGAGTYTFTGDALDEKDEAALIAASLSDGGFPILVRLQDIDHDGAQDIVYLTRMGRSGVLFRRGETFETHAIRFRTRTPWTDTPTLSFLKGLDPRYIDIFVRFQQECFLVYVSWKRFEQSKVLLEYERFRCESDESHKYYVVRRDKCLAAGGTWGPQGFFRNGGCVRPTTDAGKPCINRTDCTAGCIYTGPRVPIGTEVIGQCASSDQSVGCFQLVRDGKYAGRLCAD